MIRCRSYSTPAIALGSALGLTCTFSSRTLLASNQEIHGFRYQSCDGPICFEVRAARAWLTQMPEKSSARKPAVIHTGFSTDGQTDVTLFEPNGTAKRRYSGTGATLHPDLKLLSLEAADGSTTLFTIDTGKVETIPGGGKK